MRYFLLFLCLLPLHLNAQSVVDFEYKEGKTKCICNDIPAQKILSTLDTIKKNQRLLACCYHCIGSYYYNNFEDLKAIKYYKQALSIREKHHDSSLWKSYRNIAYAYYGVWYYEGVNQAILRGFETDEAFKQNASAYKYLGRSYVELGEFEKAIQALKNSTKLAEDNYELAEANNSLCIALTRTKDSLNLLNALKHAEKAINLFKDENDIESVAVAYTKYTQEKDTLNLAKTLNNITTILYEQDKHDEATQRLNQSLYLKKKYYQNDTYQYTYAANHENLGENYEALDDIDKALKHYQLALINLTDNFRNKDINTNPTVTDNHYIYNKPDRLRVLDLKAQAAIKSGKIDLADSTYTVLDKSINEFYKDLRTNKSKLTWIARTHDIYTNAIEVPYYFGKVIRDKLPRIYFRKKRKKNKRILLYDYYRQTTNIKKLFLKIKSN